MDNVVENNQSSRISYKNYKNRLLTVLLYFIAVLCVITAVVFPFERLQERKYIFNNEKYKKLADFFNINQTIENILFFRFTGSISRREYFITVLFIILVNAFIFIDLYIVAKLAYNLVYHHFGKMFYRLLNDMIILYIIVVLYAFIILLWNRFTNIFGTNKYNILIFTIIFVLFYFLHYVIPYNDIYMVAAFVLILFIGIIPPKKDKVNG